jgi:hypothetical protein
MLGVIAAEVVAKIPGSFLVQVPIAEMPDLPDDFDLTAQQTLEPWQPPSLHLLRAGSRSPFVPIISPVRGTAIRYHLQWAPSGG